MYSAIPFKSVQGDDCLQSKNQHEEYGPYRNDGLYLHTLLLLYLISNFASIVLMAYELMAYALVKCIDYIQYCSRGG